MNRFKFSTLATLIRAANDGEGSDLGGAEQQANLGNGFNPSTVQQGEGLLDSMKETAQQQQAAEEDTGSVSLDDNGEPKQVAADTDTTSQNAAEESSDPKETDSKDDGGAYTYNGMAVEVTNTPEMEAAFTEKGLDIDAVNKEIYSADGLTEATTAKLEEAFGVMPVKMYLEGLEAKNAAMFVTSEHAHREMTDLSNTATGGKLTEVMAWANDNLKPEDYSQYAEIINGDNKLQVRLALEDLTRQSGLGAKALTAPTVKETPALISATNVAPASADMGISVEQYNAEIVRMGSGKMSTNDWAKLDAQRELGRSNGL